MKFLLCWTLLLSTLLATGQCGLPSATPLNEEQLRMALQVLDIFKAKCVDCHGADLPRPKGKFGYVLDLKRVVETPKYVVKGDPEKSDIYTLVRDDDMPGDDANVPPLTENEKAIVKRWIEMGAPSDLPPATESASAQAVAAEPSIFPITVHPMPLWKQGFRWLGRFHPLSTHFPVALMFVAVLAEAFAWWSRREGWIETVRFLVVIAALGGVSAAGLGWLNAWFTSYVGQSASILLWHRWLGTGTAVWAVICAGLIMTHECREGSLQRARFRGALLLGAFLVGVTGFLGSALIYGLDHYNW
ncbi:MAG: hypothetical protein JWL59_3948 [Chthoniobacteraceae bacterium]|nr:hypothetical protein [Chthoniobacteraceae bacterium]